MITRGNSKLGELFHGWSIPADDACPGKSAVCETVCYGKRGHFLHTLVSEAHRRNWILTKQRDFVRRMRDELRVKQVGLLRVHVVGDYDSVAYVDKWRDIVRGSRRTTFLSYTRSWTDPEIRRSLVELGRLPNMRLWWSFDRDMPTPRRVGSIRRAYLSLDDDDLPRVPVDLVFRDRPATTMKYTPDGDLVCPYEQLVERVARVTCSNCTLCWRTAAVPSRRGKSLVTGNRPADASGADT